MRSLVRLIASIIASSCLVVIPVANARAHAIVIHSEPADGGSGPSPHRLLLRFNSRIEKALCSVKLMGPARDHVVVLQEAAGAAPDTLAYLIPALPPGTYQASWKVLSYDGHLTEGTISFSVNNP